MCCDHMEWNVDSASVCRRGRSVLSPGYRSIGMPDCRMKACVLSPGYRSIGMPDCRLKACVLSPVYRSIGMPDCRMKAFVAHMSACVELVLMLSDFANSPSLPKLLTHFA